MRGRELYGIYMSIRCLLTRCGCSFAVIVDMYVVKDLVPDMNNFYEQYKAVKPWLQLKESTEHTFQDRTGNFQAIFSSCLCFHARPLSDRVLVIVRRPGGV